MNNYALFHDHRAELIPASDPSADWLQTQYRTYLHPSDRRKLFLIRALRVLAEEEKRISEMTDQQIADEISLYGADRMWAL